MFQTKSRDTLAKSQTMHSTNALNSAQLLGLLY